MKAIQVLFVLCRCILGGLFAYAGIVKLRDPSTFSSALAALEFIPTPAINVLALGLPLVELAFGVCVLAIQISGRQEPLGSPVCWWHSLQRSAGL
jgi:uncharacterized membrane protein YphA (DoxX/SURF4 family)